MFLVDSVRAISDAQSAVWADACDGAMAIPATSANNVVPTIFKTSPRSSLQPCVDLDTRKQPGLSRGSVGRR